MDRCEVCGAFPARRVKLREVAGVVILFRVRTTAQVLCATCGTARYREASDRTLLAGWWGFLSFFVTIWALLANRAQWRRVLALGPPREWLRPEARLDPGPPLRGRRGIVVGGMVAAAVVALAVLGWLAGPDDEYVDVEELPGACLVFTDPEGTEFDTVDCRKRHDALVRSVVGRQEECPPGTDSFLRLDMVTGPDRFACLEERT